MWLTRWLLALGLAAVSCGCMVRSLNPFYSPKDVVFDPRLLGIWAKQDKDVANEGWVVLKGPESSYRLLPVEGGPVVLEGRMFKLGTHLYLDLAPAEEIFEDYFIPAHIFFQIEFAGDTLRTATPEEKKLQRMADMNILSLAHARRGDAVLLAAPTKELQAFFSAHADDGAVFSPFVEYRRAEEMTP